MAYVSTIQPLLHPLRLEILRVMEESGPTSPSDIAEDQRDLGRVAYHFRILLKAGLIRQVELVPVRGSVRHIYGLTATGRAALHSCPSCGRPWGP